MARSSRYKGDTGLLSQSPPRIRHMDGGGLVTGMDQPKIPANKRIVNG
jgi:hypothetical protein